MFQGHISSEPLNGLPQLTKRLKKGLKFKVYNPTMGFSVTQRMGVVIPSATKRGDPGHQVTRISTVENRSRGENE